MSYHATNFFSVNLYSHNHLMFPVSKISNRLRAMIDREKTLVVNTSGNIFLLFSQHVYII